MGQKYYAVKQGRKVGIFNSWDECKAQVMGYSGAVYKSFQKLEEAEAFIGIASSESPLEIASNEVIAYVDGAYNITSKVFGYGIVLIDSSDNEIELNGSVENPDYANHRNVAGEVFGSMKAIEKGIELKKSKIYIHFDYMGIEAWANGHWKTNKELTQIYKAFVEEKRKEIDVEFIKVKAHSNDKYNDRADRLAKDACGIS